MGAELFSILVFFVLSHLLFDNRKKLHRSGNLFSVYSVKINSESSVVYSIYFNHRVTQRAAQRRTEFQGEKGKRYITS